MEIPGLGGWLKLTARISSGKRNWNKKQYAGKLFTRRAIVGHWYPIMSINYHEHTMTGMMVLSGDMPYFLDLLM